MTISIDKDTGAVTWGEFVIHSALTEAEFENMLQRRPPSDVNLPLMPRRQLERQIKLPQLTSADRVINGAVHFKSGIVQGIQIIIRLPNEKSGWENWRLEDERQLHQMGLAFLETQLGSVYQVSRHTPEPGLDGHAYQLAWGKVKAFYDHRAGFPSIVIGYNRPEPTELNN